MSQHPFSPIINWKERFALANQNILFQSKVIGLKPRVTIGIPTFCRPETLNRALSAIANQTYREFILIISDNAGTNPETIDTIRAVANDLPEVYLIAQENNLGVMANLGLLLGLSQTEFFMWLADDDEITEKYLENLVDQLDNNPLAPSAMGSWYQMHDIEKGCYARQNRRVENTRIVRIFNYIAFSREDSLFYGLHRTEILRSATFEGFFPPNREMLTNFCYVFLFDLIWHGPIAYADSAAWISHNYTEKQYDRSRAVTLGDRTKTLIRRINVFLLYCMKTARQNPLMLLVAVPASLVGFTLDIVSAAVRMGKHVLTYRRA